MTTSVAQTRVIDLLDFHARAAQATRVFVAGLPPDRWTAPTNCDMDARALINHIVTGHLWAAELASGRTIADVGDQLDGDVLGSNPLAAYDHALAMAQAAFAEPGALARTCDLSYGTVSLAEYCSHRILDTFIHGWDLARATGQDDTLNSELVEAAYAMFEPHAAEFAASGAFGTPVRVSSDDDTQTRLLAMLGRDNRR
jgi:uncharacterized protein (TIGR03086 family)